MAKIFYDTEFTGLRKSTTLISIGLISETGESFYAECTDYDKSQCDDWIKKNVIANLSKDTDQLSEIADINVLGDTKEIQEELLKWLKQFDTVEWVSDVSHYDFVLLIDLLYEEGMKVPYKKVCAACHDINQDIAEYFGISEIEAFDKSREEIVEQLYGSVDIEGEKHNAFYDAVVIAAIYKAMHK